ncbi:MAG: DUF1289 domain-containing protein [Pseudomonadota bacterium]|jgi:predicted Fe-S protein YdhL (DUF1289 family)|uniref:DUF1289 domain-containing protein n=1 Tax=Burkholderiaceae TaxID=119060 RepID=UPI0010F9E80C|nr:DUF1289 domain-containing protein [Burkholderia sp. 4M9327F10]
MTAETLNQNDVIAPVPSPCINVCRMDQASGWCEGCLRTIDEIRGWSSYDDATKRAVWDTLDARHAQWMAQNRQTAK